MPILSRTMLSGTPAAAAMKAASWRCDGRYTPMPVTTLTTRSLVLAGRHAARHELHHLVHLLLRRQRAAPERVAQAQKVADAHHSPRALFGAAGRDLALLRRLLERGGVGGGEPLVVLAEPGLVDELRFLHDPVDAGMLEHEVQEAFDALALDLHAVARGRHVLRDVRAQRVAERKSTRLN